MKQDVLSAISAVTAKAQIEQKDKQNEETVKPKSFHQLSREMRAADPDNEPLRQAIANGKARTSLFMATIYDMQHPDHDKNLMLFKNAYGMDARQVEESIVAQTCKEAGAAPYETADPAYEQRVLAKFKQSGNLTQEKLKLYDCFQTGMKEKWQQRGYRGDKSFAEALASKYAMEADDAKIEMRNFQPKD